MIASAKAGMNEGADFYSKRQAGSKGSLASNENIDKAIEQFSSALQTSETEKEAALYLLKSYYSKLNLLSRIKKKRKVFSMKEKP